jgi:nucleoside-diphosphate-sugar epimerase
MPHHHVIFGCNGPVGVGLMHRLTADGHRVTGVCRSGRSDAPEGARIEAGDAADASRAAEIARDADVIHCCIGIDYRVWTKLWMPIVDGLLHATEVAGAKLIFADNLYCYGPQTQPLREDMPLTSHGVKPALRARMVEHMLDAHAKGRARVAFVRASDFFGPQVRKAFLGATVFERALQGKSAQLLPDIDQPHTYTYAPDFVRAIVDVSEADDDALGQAWHTPNPPARTTRDVVRQIFEMAGHPPKYAVMPKPLVTMVSWFVPLVREIKEMQFQRDAPYHVDSSKFERRFGWTATGWDDALRATLEWYRR